MVIVKRPILGADVQAHRDLVYGVAMGSGSLGSTFPFTFV